MDNNNNINNATQTHQQHSKLLSTCIIGAGCAGLCALRHFTTRPDRFGPIVCFEKNDRLGGTWNYTEEVGVDQRTGLPIHSSMYRDLRYTFVCLFNTHAIMLIILT